MKLFYFKLYNFIFNLFKGLRKNYTYEKIKFAFYICILFCIIAIYKYEDFCLKCINKIQNKKCFNCKASIIFQNLKIYDDDTTLDEIIHKNKSISRFGDGEFYFMSGNNIFFQAYNKEMAKRLINIVNSREKNLLIGINLPYKSKFLNRFNLNAKNYFKKFIDHFKFILSKIFKNNEYYSSTISRFYIDIKSKKNVKKYIKKLKKIWEKRDIVIVEGEKSRLGIGNNLFVNSNSIQRIICPVTNAFNRYQEIINIIKNKVNKDKLILIALGPTATVLSFDLCKLGYQALDIGHIDIEYEWYLRKAKNKIPIKNKYVCERRNSQLPFTNVSDINYWKQIIAKIID